MKSHEFLLFLRRRAILPLLAGATVLQFGGCDPTVRDALLAGVQTSVIGLMSALIAAFFEVLRNTVASPNTTAQAVFDTLRTFIA
jgi:hypothetical protein